MMYQVEKFEYSNSRHDAEPFFQSSEHWTTVVAEYQHLLSPIVDMTALPTQQLRSSLTFRYLWNRNLALERLAVSIRLSHKGCRKRRALPPRIKLVTRDDHPAPSSDLLYRSPGTHWLGCGTVSQCLAVLTFN
jgi:hypothetical protein